MLKCCIQGFNSSDSEDDHSDDDEDNDEGMSGDEEMGEQEDFEGSFDEVLDWCFWPVLHDVCEQHSASQKH